MVASSSIGQASISARSAAVRAVPEPFGTAGGTADSGMCRFPFVSATPSNPCRATRKQRSPDFHEVRAFFVASSVGLFKPGGATSPVGPVPRCGPVDDREIFRHHSATKICSPTSSQHHSCRDAGVCSGSDRCDSQRVRPVRAGQDRSCWLR